MQILTSTYSISRGCLIAALLLVNLIPRLVQANKGPGSIWGVNAKNQIFTWTGDGWRQIGELKYVSASADGAVWGVSKDEVFRWTDNSFTPVPNGRLKQLSVGNPKNIWASMLRTDLYLDREWLATDRRRAEVCIGQRRW